MVVDYDTPVMATTLIYMNDCTAYHHTLQTASDTACSHEHLKECIG